MDILVHLRVLQLQLYLYSCPGIYNDIQVIIHGKVKP